MWLRQGSICWARLNTVWAVGVRKSEGTSSGVEASFVCWVKRGQLDVTCFISLLNAHHVSDVNTSILRSLRLICWVISWVVLLWFDVCWCYVVVWLGWCGIRTQAEALVPQPAYGYHEITQQISRKLLRMDVLTSETWWALSNEIISKWHQVGLSLFNRNAYICVYWNDVGFSCLKLKLSGWTEDVEWGRGGGWWREKTY